MRRAVQRPTQRGAGPAARATPRTGTPRPPKAPRWPRRSTESAQTRRKLVTNARCSVPPAPPRCADAPRESTYSGLAASKLTLVGAQRGGRPVECLRRAARPTRAGSSDDAIRTRVQNGLLHPFYRGVYAWGHAKLSLEGCFLAAVKACGPGRRPEPLLRRRAVASARVGLPRPRSHRQERAQARRHQHPQEPHHRASPRATSSRAASSRRNSAAGSRRARRPPSTRCSSPG